MRTLFGQMKKDPETEMNGQKEGKIRWQFIGIRKGKGLSVCHTNQKGYKRNPEYMFSNYFRVFSRVERVYHAAI